MLPIDNGPHVEQFKAAENRVKIMKQELHGNVTSYGWHGTRRDYAYSIVEDGFNMSKINGRIIVFIKRLTRDLVISSGLPSRPQQIRLNSSFKGTVCSFGLIKVIAKWLW